jgi:hypothetical protein
MILFDWKTFCRLYLSWEERTISCQSLMVPHLSDANVLSLAWRLSCEAEREKMQPHLQFLNLMNLT